MRAARVEPKNGPKENKKIGNFKPLVLSEFQAAVDIAQCFAGGADHSSSMAQQLNKRASALAAAGCHSHCRCPSSANMRSGGEVPA
jgi:hypothetical protein